MFQTQETMSETTSHQLCSVGDVHSDGFGVVLQERWRSVVQPYMTNVDRSVIASYQITGCASDQAPGGRRLLQQVAGSVVLLQTIVVHTLNSVQPTIEVDLMSMVRTFQQSNSTIELQWDITGGGAAVVMHTGVVPPSNTTLPPSPSPRPPLPPSPPSDGRRYPGMFTDTSSDAPHLRSTHLAMLLAFALGGRLLYGA